MQPKINVIKPLFLRYIFLTGFILSMNLLPVFAQVISIRHDQSLDGKIVAVGENAVYQFAGIAGNTISIDLLRIAGALHPKIEIYDPAGDMIKAMDDSSQIVLQDFKLEKSGDYLIRVSDKYSSSTGGYKLYLYVLEQDETVTIIHNQELKDSIDPVGDMDKFSFYGAKGSNLTILLNKLSGSFHPKIELFDPLGNMVQKLDDSSQVLLRDYKLDQAGDYLIRVSDKYADQTGEYSIFISFFPPPVYVSPTPTTGPLPEPSPTGTATPPMLPTLTPVMTPGSTPGTTPSPDTNPVPDVVYEFDASSLSGTGWSDSILSGFSGNPAGSVQLSSLDKSQFPNSEDGAGLLIHVAEGTDSVLQPYKPPQVCFLFGKEAINTGKHPVFIRAWIKADDNGGNAEIYLGALKGNLAVGNVDGSIAFISPKNSSNYRTVKSLSCYYKPDDDTQLITPFIQVAAKEDGNNATISIDRLELFILKPGVKYDGVLFEE